ncbi:putative ABC transport system permease protein [Phenylobacterium haematophilum]|uniref:Putative ABC transport system permease protein n=1 Tax=Phenylobacterium haematophilum TaxID=98513 RepID=A0A839ZX94_9CAUL|nr:ABC transporter permease [Phenylobacterium haematophilum]MBB3889910.1 putative ABC transport system permease protein [Phenylobacterium haematophilum]
MSNARAPEQRGLAARWMIFGEWRAHPMRVITAAAAIAVGVALGLAVHLVNASALSEFSKAVSAVNGEAELQVRSTTTLGFAEALYPRVARTEGVAAVSPVVELEAVTDRPGETLTVLGLDVLRAAYVTPSLIGRPLAAEGDEARGPTMEAAFDENAVFLSPAALEGRAVGQQIELSAGGRREVFRIAGVLPGVGDERRLAVLDIAAAQWRLGTLGRLQRLDLKLAEGADVARVADELRAALPNDAQLVSQESEARRSDSLSRAYRVNLDMLALMALLTGGFLVYSAQSLSVARRRPQFALLRVLGVRRRALLSQVMAEGVGVGLAGGVVGIGLGFALADVALTLLGGDLGGGYFSETKPQLVLTPGPALLFLALGLATAVVGSLAPAREAARAPPAVALKNAGDAIDPRATPPIWPAAVLLAFGAAAAFAPPIGGVPLLGYASMALLLAGGVAAMPRLARVLLAGLKARSFVGAAPDLAVKRLWGAPSQAAVALCGVVASTSLMVAMAVMVSSFRGSVEDWLAQVLPADLYLRIEAAESGGGFDPEEQGRLAATPGVARIAFMRTTTLRMSADAPPLALVARPEGGLDAGAPPMIGRTAEAPAGTIPILVSEPAAWIYGWKVGQRISLPIGGAPPNGFFVTGVWRDYARQHGAVTLESRDYTAITGDRTRSEASVTLKPGADRKAVALALQSNVPERLAGRVTVAEPRALRDMALRLFDRSFAVTYGLEAIAIVVGLAGVAATISAQTLARTKEFGMLRHLGVTRGQIVAMLATEGALLGMVGGLAGIGLGLIMSQVLIHVVNPQSFHWTMETKLPWVLLGGVGVALVASAAGTALLAGRQAVSADAVRAVREDW